MNMLQSYSFLLQGSIVTDRVNANATYCVYDSDIATGYGVGSFLFLLSAQSVLMAVTKCMCFGRPLAPGGSRAWSIIYFAGSWYAQKLNLFTILFVPFLVKMAVCTILANIKLHKACKYVAAY